MIFLEEPSFGSTVGRDAKSGLIEDLTLLLTTDVTTYTNYIHSILMIEAETEAAKARLRYIGWKAQRKVAREARRIRRERRR